MSCGKNPLHRAVLLAGILILVISSSAGAAPSTSGSTGMIHVPTADSLRFGQFSAGYYYWQDHGTGLVALGLPRGIEVSAASRRNEGLADTGIVNIKFNLNQEALLYPAVAIGVEDIEGRERRSVYGVLSKALPYGFRIHFGTGTGRFDGMFASLEKVLNPVSIRKNNSGFPVTSLIIEMDGTKMNYGARLRLAQGLRLDAGWLGREERVYCGLTFTN